MDESEVREIASQIEAAGWGTMVPDMPVPLSTSGVPAGLPNLPGDAEDEYLMVPRQLVGYDPVVMITVHGESMCDAGIEDGDIVTMRVASTAEDGDIVVAMLDGEVTLKAFFRDESGEAWLVPQNAMYKPIRVSEFTDVRILGRVVDVRKPVGRVSYRQIQQQMRSIQRRSEEERPRLSDEVIRRAVARVVPMMTNNRQWFCIYRVLADKGVLSDGAFYELSQLVNGYTAVCVTVKGKSAVAALFRNVLHKMMYVCAAAVLIYVVTVGLVSYDQHLSSQRGKQLPGGIRRAAVCAVQSDFKSAEVVGDYLLYMADVFVYGVFTVYGPAHIFMGAEFYLLGSIKHKALYFILGILHDLMSL